MVTADGETMTHPLQQLTVDGAKGFQFRLVDLIHRHFDGREVLEAGDYGAPPELGRSKATAKVEAVLAEFFHAEDAALVTGAGTGAIRAGLIAVLEPGASVVVHDFPIYATTAVTFRAMGLRRMAVDLNDERGRANVLRERPDMVYLQHSRQRLDDAFNIADVIAEARRFAPEATVMVDDNYTVMQVPRSGVELGADLSAFSLFKLLGEPGVGGVIGRADLVRRIRDDAYSGGSKVQGPAAIASLKGLVYAPVALAVQSEVVDEVIERLNAGELSGVARAFPGNHQERSILVELEEPIARDVFDVAWRWGAAPYPVGSQSRFETNALIYRLSRAMCEADPELAERMVRISPFRSGGSTIIRVLGAAIEAARAKVA
jgi:hypothetical protein